MINCWSVQAMVRFTVDLLSHSKSSHLIHNLEQVTLFYWLLFFLFFSPLFVLFSCKLCLPLRASLNCFFQLFFRFSCENHSVQFVCQKVSPLTWHIKVQWLVTLWVFLVRIKHKRSDGQKNNQAPSNNEFKSTGEVNLLQIQWSCELQERLKSLDFRCFKRKTQTERHSFASQVSVRHEFTVESQLIEEERERERLQSHRHQRVNRSHHP